MPVKPVLMIGNLRLRETSSDVVFEEDNVAAIVVKVVEYNGGQY